MMMLRHTLLAIATLLLVVTRVSGADDLTIELRVAATARLGEAVPLSVVFSQRSDDGLYLEFSGADYGGESLVVCAQDDEGRWSRIGQIHLDRDIAARRFDFVPLRRGQRFESPILAINDPEAGPLPALRLTEAGTYDLIVRFESRGETQAGVLWPVWRGVVTSAPQKLTLTAPAPDVIKKNRASLRTCASDSAECASAVIGYFMTVRDQEAADVLAQMLDEAKVPDPLLAQAVANQSGVRARGALSHFVTRFPQYAGFVASLSSPAADDLVCGREE